MGREREREREQTRKTRERRREKKDRDGARTHARERERDTERERLKTHTCVRARKRLRTYVPLPKVQQDTLQQTHCTATDCNKPSALQHTATNRAYFNILQQTAAHCSELLPSKKKNGSHQIFEMEELSPEEY